MKFGFVSTSLPAKASFGDELSAAVEDSISRPDIDQPAR
jgi:hypothetical protein